MAKKDEEWRLDAPLLDEQLLQKRLDRRRFMKAAGLSGAALGLSGFPAACKNAVGGGPAKIGYVSPKTGPFSEFGEADTFTLGNMNQVFSKSLKIAGSTRKITIISKDSQSDLTEPLRWPATSSTTTTSTSWWFRRLPRPLTRSPTSARPQEFRASPR
jgi:hypothetical protein